MRGFEVRAPELAEAAGACDRASTTAGGAAFALRGAGLPDTGRADTAARVAELTAALARATDELGRLLSEDARELRAAAARYTTTDHAVVRPAPGPPAAR